MTESETLKHLTTELLELFQFSTPKNLRRSLQNVIMEFIAEQNPEMIDKITVQNFQYLINFLDIADELCNSVLDETYSEDDKRIEKA